MGQIGVFTLDQYQSLDGLSYTNQGRNLKTWWNFEDFIESHVPGAQVFGIYTSLYSGAGALVGDGFATSVRPGQVQFTTGTTTTGYASLGAGRNSLAPFTLGAGVYTWEADIYISTLSAVAEEYIIRVGFGDQQNADMVDGVYFIYDRLGIGGNWICGTANNSARSQTNSGVAVLQTNWIRLKIVVDTTPAALFYINGTLVQTMTTNIPTGGGRNTTLMHHIVKSAGTTARDFYLDWVWAHFDLTASR